MTKIEVWTRLQGDDEFLIECLKILYKLQTVHEQISKSTTETNRIGFNKGDSPFLSKFVETIEIRHSDLLDIQMVYPDELILAREKMLKYSQQLANIFTANDDDVA